MVNFVSSNSTYNVITCKKCGSNLEYTNDEIKEAGRSEGLGGYSDWYNYIICPTCNNKIEVNN